MINFNVITDLYRDPIVNHFSENYPDYEATFCSFFAEATLRYIDSGFYSTDVMNTISGYVEEGGRPTELTIASLNKDFDVEVNGYVIPVGTFDKYSDYFPIRVNLSRRMDGNTFYNDEQPSMVSMNVGELGLLAHRFTIGDTRKGHMLVVLKTTVGFKFFDYSAVYDVNESPGFLQQYARDRGFKEAVFGFIKLKDQSVLRLIKS
ncbi:hypothetical protein L4D09_13195 [Photobacterium makurazakiensis]|uniref:hypothetical protein n=1 Tax=Photobacterium makurazakiensis TaxID=2910234 RepID=UPI003D0D470D